MDGIVPHQLPKKRASQKLKDREAVECAARNNEHNITYSF